MKEPLKNIKRLAYGRYQVQLGKAHTAEHILVEMTDKPQQLLCTPIATGNALELVIAVLTPFHKAQCEAQVCCKIAAPIPVHRPQDYARSFGEYRKGEQAQQAPFLYLAEETKVLVGIESITRVQPELYRLALKTNQDPSTTHVDFRVQRYRDISITNAAEYFSRWALDTGVSLLNLYQTVAAFHQALCDVKSSELSLQYSGT